MELVTYHTYTWQQCKVSEMNDEWMAQCNGVSMRKECNEPFCAAMPIPCLHCVRDCSGKPTATILKGGGEDLERKARPEG
jgi:hypothetical protein